MNKLAEQARSQAKSKLASYVRNDPHARVDASNYEPSGALNGDVQTGMRVLSRRQYAGGGKVPGAMSCAHAGRKPRASGGKAIANDFINRDDRAANKERDGIKFIGGFMAGGRAQKAVGGPMGLQPVPSMKAGGGGVHKDEAQDRELIHKMGCSCARCRGGRAGRASGGGNWIAGAIKHPGALHKELHVPQGEKIPEKKLDKAAKMGGKEGARARLAKTLKGFHKAGGGGVSQRETNIEPSLPARAMAVGAMKMAQKKGVDPYDSQPKQAAAYKQMFNMRQGKPARSDGGVISGGTRPAGGRMPRAGGGKTDWVAKNSPLKPHEMDALKKENAEGMKKGLAPAPLVQDNQRPRYGAGHFAKGGRMARKGGGRTKKGMNVNIIIAPSQPSPRPMMPPPGGPPMPPGAGPMGLHAGAPPPVGPPPQMPPAGAGMPRKDGGSVVGHFAKPGRYPIKNASGGAKGRLEKIRAYG